MANNQLQVFGYLRGVNRKMQWMLRYFFALAARESENCEYHHAEFVTYLESANNIWRITTARENYENVTCVRCNT